MVFVTSYLSCLRIFQKNSRGSYITEDGGLFFILYIHTRMTIHPRHENTVTMAKLRNGKVLKQNNDTTSIKLTLYCRSCTYSSIYTSSRPRHLQDTGYCVYGTAGSRLALRSRLFQKKRFQ